MYKDRHFNVLDKGYVRLVDSMGNDLSVINAARASYDKESWLDEDGKLFTKDDKLLKFLIREKHWSPFRHATVTYEFNAPLMVARQHWKHVVASTYVDDQNGWNEASQRYITGGFEFYIPAENEWRSKPANSKQGSGEPLPAEMGMMITDDLMAYIDMGLNKYEEYVSQGVAPEQARLFLPAYGLYVKYRWTASLQAVLNFLDLRLPKDAQAEITQYAKAVERLTGPVFPSTFEAWGLDSPD
jgi:thymidylate synthase (FAD)